MMVSKQDWDVLRLQRGDITRDEFCERNPDSPLTRILKGEKPKVTKSGKSYYAIDNVVYPHFGV